MARAQWEHYGTEDRTGFETNNGAELSAGKRLSGKTGQGNRWVRTALVQAAHGAVKGKESYLGSFYRRLVSRQGVKKAIVAVEHKLLVIAYSLLSTGEHYCDIGPIYLDARRKQHTVQRLRERMIQLGYTVTLKPIALPSLSA